MDRGFNLEPHCYGRPDGTADPCAGAQRSRTDAAPKADRAIIAVTLCGTLIAATLGILYLMATGHNVAKEVSLMVGAQWGALLAVYARGMK